MRSTREEEARRLAEIAEKYAGTHTIRPYRVHVIAVPALRIPADVRRGDRRYPMAFDWLLPAGSFAPVRCPSCGSEAPLVAGKQKLGCESCLPPRAAEPVPAPVVKAAAPKAPPVKSAPPPKPASPAAAPVRKPPVPPRARQREKPRLPAQLVADLWTAVARGLAGNAVPLLEPGSPASVLYRVFGAPGLTQVIGMSPGVLPDGYTADEYQLGSSANLVAGVLSGTDESQHHYFLSHRGGLVLEVLPCPAYASGQLWNAFWSWQPGDESWSARRVRRAADIDRVGRLLFTAGPSWHGLAVTARSAAAWERIADFHPSVLHGRLPAAVAAAVDRLVDYRAGGRGPFAAAADVYGVTEQAVRQADRTLRPLLTLGPGGQAWLPHLVAALPRIAGAGVAGQDDHVCEGTASLLAVYVRTCVRTYTLTSDDARGAGCSACLAATAEGRLVYGD